VLAPFSAVDRCVTIFLAVCAWVVLNIPGIAISQTVPITPSGLHTQVSDPIAVGGQTQFDITGGTRPGGASGTNLFHSFDTFRVPTDNIANFLNGASFDLNGNSLAVGLPTTTILARVTGNIQSDIYGTIQTTGFGNAQLFLMNPNGFLFGPNATVNVGGMAHFTTADYLRLSEPGGGNSGIFHASLAQTNILTTALVAAFGFLGSNPAAIQVAGSTLILASGTGLSLVGGDISIGADPETGTPSFISAPSGKIDLVSVASSGEILYPSLQTGPNIDGQTFTAKGTVSISEFSFLDVSGTAGEGNEAGGVVRIRGGQFVMDNLSAIQNMTLGNTAGENPGISIVVDHDVRLSNLSSISVGTGAGLGRSGNLEVSAENIEILNGSFLSSISGGPAAPGDLTITATQSLTVSGLDPFVGTEPSTISTTAQSSVVGGNITIDSAGSTLSVQDNASIGTSSDTGRAGNITLNSDVLNVTNGGAVRTTSINGSSGTIVITANDSAVISGQSALGNFSTIANSSQTSPANISITAGQFVLADKAAIDGDTASQQGGTVNITATQSINISGNSTIRSSTAAGTGTSLELSAPTIAIDQGTLSTRISGSDPNNVGGTIKVSATDGNLTVSNNSLIAASTQEGAATGGRIELSASDSTTVTANSRIESTSTGTGNAGNIQIDAGNQFAMTNSAVTTEANQASGGTIKITTTPNGTVQLTDSLISASVLDGTSGGGSVNIDPQFVILQNSQILAQAKQGPGGNISITTNLLLPDANSVISASSGNPALNGTVTIQSPNAPASGKIQPLGKSPLLATSLLNQHCASLAGGEFSSFTVAGRDSLPTEPGSWLASPLASLNVGMGLGVKAEGVRPVARGEGLEGETALLSLRQIAPPGFLTQAFALDWSAGCKS
jgi:filamentous hemagglutinin family protein